MISHKHKLRWFVNVILLLAMVFPLTGPQAAYRPEALAAAPLPEEPATWKGAEPFAAWTDLFRVWVTFPNASSRDRLDALEVVVLEETATRALILADSVQLETLARLRFRPEAADDLGMLVEHHADTAPELARSIQPLLTQARTTRALRLDTGVDTGRALNTRDALALQRAQTDLRATLHSLTVAQQAGIMAMSNIDSDGDGLTDTEEYWWCTDPLNPDTKGDGVSDGDAVAALMAWMHNELPGPPASGTPFLGWPMVPGDGQFNPNCVDQDQDSVPDMAERWMLGLNANRESTSGDKFDDGQKLFGITHPNYGELPRSEDTFITMNMPGWVTPPGNHPLVAAYPVIDIFIVPNSLQVTLVTEVTTAETHGVGETVSYETSHTEGTSTGIGKEESHTHSRWQEIGNSIADSWERSQYQSTMQSWSQQYNWEHSVGKTHEEERGGHWDVTLGAEVSAEFDLASLGTLVGAAKGTAVKPGVGTVVGAIVGGTTLGATGSIEGTYGQSWSDRHVTTEQTTHGGVSGYEISRETGNSFSVGQVYERSQVVGAGYERTQATTITREDYKEFSVTNGNQFATTQEWSTATAVNTSHAANLVFAYRVRNTGTDSARRIENILFNIYIDGERNPISTYAGVLTGDTCTQVVIDNLYPGHFFPTVGNATQCKIALNLDQLALIDQGANVRVVVADFSYGSDQDFYENAWTQGVIVEVDTGRDGNEEIDAYLIPTWGVETYQDVLKRYFPVTETGSGDILSISVPEFDANHNIAAWHEYAISDRSWWNVYLSEYGDGLVVPFRDRMAMPKSRLLLRFNQDTDGDHFSDRVERKLQTDLSNPYDHPNARLVAGYYEVRQGNAVQVQLAMQNIGNYDAIGTQAMMYARDNTITVDNSLVGMAGLIPVGETVLLSSHILDPVPVRWTETAQPVVSGHYTGNSDNIYTFTVSTDGQIGVTPDLQLDWIDIFGNSGSLDVGEGYLTPMRMPVSEGIVIGMGSGSVAADDHFAITCLAPRDVFSYTINQEPYTKPLIIVSYNDPSGNQRLVTPVQLEQITDGLFPHSDKMEAAPELSIISESPFNPSGDNSITLSFLNPQSDAIVDGNLVIAYATSVTGTVVAAHVITTTFLPGPNLYTDTWNTLEFSPTYQASIPHKVKVFAMDYEGRFLDVAFEQFDRLGNSQRPTLMMSQLEPDDLVWDFGIAAKGTLMKHTLAIANTGWDILMLYASPSMGISLSQSENLHLTPGDVSYIEILVNTDDLPIGAVNETVTLRTNDPDHPSRTLQISGMVVAPEHTTRGIRTLEMLPTFAASNSSVHPTDDIPRGRQTTVCKDLQRRLAEYEGEGVLNLWFHAMNLTLCSSYNDQAHWAWSEHQTLNWSEQRLSSLNFSGGGR